MREIKSGTPLDTARLIFVTYLIMKVDIDKMGPKPHPIDRVTCDTKCQMVLEASVKSIVNHMDICAALEPLAVDLILGCPDITKYVYPVTFLRNIAVAGRMWLANDDNEFTAEEEAQNKIMLDQVSEWLDRVNDELYAKLERGEDYAPEDLIKQFSSDFQEGMEQFREHLKEEGLPDPGEEMAAAIDKNVSKVLYKASLENMMNNFPVDDEDIN